MSAATRPGLALAVSLLAGVALTAPHPARAEATPPTENKLPLEELRTFTGVLDAVKQDYVESDRITSSRSRIRICWKTPFAAC